MGNQCCTSRKGTGCVFTETELERLNVLYDELEADPASANGTLSLTRVFPENPDLATRVSHFMKKNSYGGHIDYGSFEASLEVLIKEAAGYKLKNFQDLEKVDILAILLLDQTHMSPQKFSKIPVQYDHACYYVETLLRIFQHIDGHASNIEAVAVRAVVDGVFNKGPQTPVNWWQFLEHIKKNLLCANRLIQFYFTTKFLQRPVRLRLPGLTQPSTLLSRDLLGLLYLSNMYLHPIDRMECLNSSQYNAMAFQSILQSLKTYNGPTLFLIRASVPDPTPNNFLLGAFSLSQWDDSTSYQGNNGTYLFSIAPTFQMFLPTYTQTNQYTFLNSSGTTNVGIGFGSDGKGGYRLWIDGKDPAKSYARAEDTTFKSGPLVPGYNGQIVVNYVEVWGLGAGLSVISDSTFLEGDSLIVRKPWITYNNAKISELHSGSPHIAKQMAEFENRISSLNQSPYPGEGHRVQGIQGSTGHYEHFDKKGFDMNQTSHSNVSIESPARPQEREKKSGYNRDAISIEGRSTYSTPLRTEQPQMSTYSDRGRSTYTVTDGFYNPFKEKNEPILKRMSHNEGAYQQNNQQRVDIRSQW